MDVAVVIPARFASTRFPGKPLVPITLKTGSDRVTKPMVQWVYEAATRARSVQRVIVATDDDRIVKVVEEFGGEALLTPSELASGTDRVAWVAQKISGPKIWVNAQGDEPLLKPETVDATVELVKSGRFPIGTPMTAMTSDEELRDPNVVKALCDLQGRAVYFSRYPIPYSRTQPEGAAYGCYKHLGLYVYEAQTLQRFCKLPVSPWEKGESLEQLRALYHGIPIGLIEVQQHAIGVDTPQDLEKIRRTQS